MAEALVELAAHAVLTVVTSNRGSVVAARLRHVGIDGFYAVLGAEAGRARARESRCG